MSEENNETIFQKYTKTFTGNFVEIGTDRGKSAEYTMKISKCAKLYCIDPYSNYEEYKDSIKYTTGDELFEQVKNRLKQYGDRIEIIRDFSSNAVDKVPNELDFVFIDGNHSYKYVLEDLRNWYPKVRSGGIIIGDDCVDMDDSQRDQNLDVVVYWNEYCYGNYGVYKAVRDFSEENGIEFSVVGRQFLIIKK